MKEITGGTAEEMKGLPWNLMETGTGVGGWVGKDCCFSLKVL